MAEKADENLNDELRYFIGEDEFIENVQKWKEVRYYYFSFVHPHFSQVLPEILTGEKEREKDRNITIFIFL